MTVFIESRRARRARIAQLDPSDLRQAFALRDALVTDPDAEVRMLAVLQLNAEAARRLVTYVRDATSDYSVRVREAAFVALARASDGASLPRAARACQNDRGFRVRRAALLFGARTCGTDALPLLALTTRDPFWRVRVAARRAGAALDAAIDMTEIGALDPPEVTIAAIDDPDPAVVTARLLRAPDALDAADLIGALGHSHQPLRRAAVNAIATRGSANTLRAVANWLIDDRVPNAPAAAEATLARSGARGDTVAIRMLHEADGAEPGPLAWALRSASRLPAWRRIEAFLAHPDPRVRRAAVVRAPESAPSRDALFATMTSFLTDTDEATQIHAAEWLFHTRSRVGFAALVQIDLRGGPTQLRSRVVEASRHLRDLDALRRHADDPHATVRASALAALSAHGALSTLERDVLAHDPDPWVRSAVLVPGRALAALEDADVHVRRAAVALLDDDDARARWAQVPTTRSDVDPHLRAHAATILANVQTATAAKTLLRLSRDADLGVRSAAVAALEPHRAAVLDLLTTGSLVTDERIAAYTLLRLGGISDPGWLETDPRATAHLSLLANVLEGRAPVTTETTRRNPERTDTPRRQLGRSDIHVSPFGLSGAHGLAFEDFALARERGVDLLFWEPSHRELSRFLRTSPGKQAVVVAGTYHADAASVERDVVSALRTLERGALDVFLAFWTRSPARIDEVEATLRDLRRRGLVRAIGISTHDRALACSAASRGFDVVMVRHSAAHRGAESAVFPHCAAQGVGVLTFSNLCYGRMLHRTPAAPSVKVTPADCYRYSISQPGVHACIAAPRRHSELLEDLTVIDDPEMSAERQTELRAHGDHVYTQSKAWSAETWRVAERPRPHRTSGERSLAQLADEIDSISTRP